MSSLPPQLPAQALPTHLNEPQAVVVCVLQAPAPSHCAAFACVATSAQTCAAQVRLASWLPANEQVARLPAAHEPAHKPLPAQLPPWAASGCPDVTAVQVPRLVPMSQASHWPVQARSQQ